MRPTPTLFLVLAAACSSPGPPALPFDARPIMAGVRADAQVIALDLADGREALAADAAARLATLRLSAGYEAATDPDFLQLEQAFRDQAAQLADALGREDGPAAQRDFDGLLDRCTACHARYRPGGTEGL